MRLVVAKPARFPAVDYSMKKWSNAKLCPPINLLGLFCGGHCAIHWVSGRMILLPNTNGDYQDTGYSRWLSCPTDSSGIVRHLWPSSDGNSVEQGRGRPNIGNNFLEPQFLRLRVATRRISLHEWSSVGRLLCNPVPPLEAFPMPILATTDKPSYIDPTRLYSLRKFVTDSGISLTRIRQAAHQGIELPKVKAGKRVFVRGRDGIEFIVKLDQRERQANGPQSAKCKRTQSPF